MPYKYFALTVKDENACILETFFLSEIVVHKLVMMVLAEKHLGLVHSITMPLIYGISYQ